MEWSRSNSWFSFLKIPETIWNFCWEIMFCKIILININFLPCNISMLFSISVSSEATVIFSVVSNWIQLCIFKQEYFTTISQVFGIVAICNKTTKHRVNLRNWILFFSWFLVIFLFYLEIFNFLLWFTNSHRLNIIIRCLVLWRRLCVGKVLIEWTMKKISFNQHFECLTLWQSSIWTVTTFVWCE